jgi:adenylate cyclase
MDIKVLIVDDSRLVRLKLKDILEADQEYHFTLNFCEDGLQALRYLCSIEQSQLPDIIILDRNMPALTGDECIRIVRNDEYLKHIPILFLTAQENKTEVVKGLLELQADDYLSKPFDDGEVLARIKVLVRMKVAEDQTRTLIHDLESSYQSIHQLNIDLEKANTFIRKTFGRYLSKEIVDTIMESPEGLDLGGEKRVLTMMMTDLRGFTGMCERLEAELIVEILNDYLGRMTEIIFKYKGTIDEFIGDAILAIFGAPIRREDDAARAIACAIEMQLALEVFNKEKKGYPELKMGIGINTGSCIVGNIGSHQRAKYGIVGRQVNLTSRIESYTVGGQILISESTQKACKSPLRIDNQMKVTPKGVHESLIVNQIGGIGSPFDLYLPELPPLSYVLLKTPLTLEFVILLGKDAGHLYHRGQISHLAKESAHMQTSVSLSRLDNIKIKIFNTKNELISSELYAKVSEVQSSSETSSVYLLHFTSLPQEVQSFFESCLSPV